MAPPDALRGGSSGYNPGGGHRGRRIVMVTPTRTVVVAPDSEVGKLLEQADQAPLVIERNGARYRVVREPDAVDPFADYDPVEARAALNRVFGILSGVDREALKAELREQREQDSLGRPA
jgi:hypothetical protein